MLTNFIRDSSSDSTDYFLHNMMFLVAHSAMMFQTQLQQINIFLFCDVLLPIYLIAY